MSISIYIKGRYEDLCGFGRPKNKANSKPNKANSPSFGRKSEILSPKSDNSGTFTGCLLPRAGRETDRMEAKRQIPAHFKGCYLKKQSQC